MHNTQKDGSQTQSVYHSESTNSKLITLTKSEDHWSCIAHLSAEDMLKSAVIEEKKFKHRQPIRAKFLMSTGRPHHYGHLLQV